MIKYSDIKDDETKSKLQEINSQFMKLIIGIEQAGLSASKKFELQMIANTIKFTKEIEAIEGEIPGFDYIEGLLLEHAVETATDFLTIDELIADYEEHAANEKS